MEITNEVVLKHRELYQQWTEIDEALNKAETEAKLGNAEQDVTLIRPNKQEVKIKEKYVWVEARAGVEEALEFIYAKYPHIKELNDKQNAKIDEIKKFEVENLGFTYKEMTLPNVIKLIQALIKAEQQLG